MLKPTYEPLKPFGWRLGDYAISCKDCREWRAASKYSIRCYDCAVVAWRAAQTTIGTPPALVDPDASRYHHVRRVLSAALGLTKAEIDGLIDRQRVEGGESQ
jgi:hypothetical protein